MVAVLVTADIRALLEAASAAKAIQSTDSVDTISHKALSRALSNLPDPDRPSLHSLLQSTELHLTHEHAVLQHRPPQRDPQLERRMRELRRRLEGQEYAHIVRDIARTSAVDHVQREHVRMGKLAPQMSLAFNVVVTMATCFVAAYFVFKNTTGSETVGLIAGVFGMIVAMIVEAVLLLTKMYSLDDAVRRKENATKRQQERSQDESQRS